MEYKQGPLHAKLNMKNAIAVGISKGKVLNVRSKVNDHNIYLELDVLFNELQTSSDFNGGGRFRDFKVKSSGHANLTHCKFISFIQKKIVENFFDY